MKKPDRFERVVLSQFERWRSAVGDTAQWHCPDVIKLLRKEHRWMERMIRRHAHSIDGLRSDLHPDFVSGYLQASEEFLSMLKQRRK